MLRIIFRITKHLRTVAPSIRKPDAHNISCLAKSSLPILGEEKESISEKEMEKSMIVG